MKQYNSISNAEWKVMKVLWSNEEVTLPKILAELTETGWSKTTIQTYVARLVKKGIVAVKRVGRGYIYIPLVDEVDCQITESKKFLDMVFEGSLSNMVLNMLNTGKISEAELEELKSIVEREEKDNG